MELKFFVVIPGGVTDTDLVLGCKFMLLTAGWVRVVLGSLAQILYFHLISLVLSVLPGIFSCFPFILALYSTSNCKHYAAVLSLLRRLSD